MTFKVKLSEIAITAEEFAARVAAHFERLVEYYKHLDGVRADAANPDLKDEDKRVAFPPPAEDDKVELAIYRERHADGSVTPHIDYEFEGPSLQEKKDALLAKVKEMETKALHEAVPPHKARHWHFREQDIIEADHNLRVDNPGHDEDWYLAHRPYADQTFLNEHAERKAKQQRILRVAAKHEHDISDLTEANVDSYKVGGEFA